DGSVWCGTERGLARVAETGVAIVESVAGQTLGAVTAVAVDRLGRVWIGSGSSFAGAYRRGEDGGWERLGAADGFADAHVHRITTDPTGALWFSVLHPPGGDASEGGGAWVFSGGTFRVSPAHGQLPSARVYDVVARDAAGKLWFATLGGLAAYDGSRVSVLGPEQGIPAGKVWCLCAGRDGSLWAGYQVEGEGATRIARGTSRRFTSADGLCNDHVWSIAEGETGVFWFATAGGLARYDGRRWSCFRKGDGLPAETLWPLLAMRDGSLYVGTLGGGLVHLRMQDRDPPRTSLGLDERHADAGSTLSISWTGTDAWFDTPAPDLHYRWRVDDDRWSEAAPATSLELAVREGPQRLFVQAIDRFGNAEDPPACVRIVGRPTGLALPWGWALAAAATIGLLAAAKHFLPRPR
ncbi:MAG: ligand-binding sensor domain-containing protein, partial [Planctomycetota bacterium]